VHARALDHVGLAKRRDGLGAVTRDLDARQTDADVEHARVPEHLALLGQHGGPGRVPPRVVDGDDARVERHLRSDVALARGVQPRLQRTANVLDGIALDRPRRG